MSARDSGAVADQDYVEAVVRRAGTSFYAAMRCLRGPKRAAMFAVYAFCREVDDIADDPGDAAGKRTRLREWRDEIDRLYAGHPQTRLSRALAPAVAAFGLRKSDFLAVIEGMEMDAAASVRIADGDQLRLYCDRVAGAVGRLSNRIFGVDDVRGERIAATLGEALQLTNILRDLREDAERDRLYLPADRLKGLGIADGDARAVLADPRLAAACDELARLAARRFDEAGALLDACDRRRVRPAIVMMAAYRRIFRRLRARGWRSLDRPVVLSRVEKAWIFLRHGVL